VEGGDNGAGHPLLEVLRDKLDKLSAPKERGWIEPLGSCCQCGTLESVKTIVTIEKKSPIAGHGWGNSKCPCQLPRDGALFVLCDGCSRRYQKRPFKPKFACRGYPGSEGRIPFSKLRGVHRHTCGAGGGSRLTRVPVIQEGDT